MDFEYCQLFLLFLVCFLVPFCLFSYIFFIRSLCHFWTYNTEVYLCISVLLIFDFFLLFFNIVSYFGYLLFVLFFFVCLYYIFVRNLSFFERITRRFVFRLIHSVCLCLFVFFFPPPPQGQPVLRCLCLPWIEVTWSMRITTQRQHCIFLFVYLYTFAFLFV